VSFTLSAPGARTLGEAAAALEAAARHLREYQDDPMFQHGAPHGEITGAVAGAISWDLVIDEEAPSP
jgi:hypothetical protein